MQLLKIPPVVPILRELTPLDILGPSCVLWYLGGDVHLTSGVVDTANDRALLNGAQNLTQATAGSRPAPVTTFNGLAAISADGVDDYLAGSPASIPVNSKPWAWVVAKMNSATSGAHLFNLCNAAANQSGLCIGRTAGGLFTWLLRTGAGQDIITGPAIDTNRHLFEGGFRATTTKRCYLDNVAYTTGSSGTGGNVDAYDTARLFTTPTNTPLASFGPYSVAEVVVYYNGTTEITDTQRARMVDYFRQRPYGLSI